MALGPNPSLVRKLLVPLVRSGLVRSTMGKHGGVQLGRPSAEIALGDIYLATQGAGRLWSARPEMPHVCLITSTAGDFFRNLADQAEQAVLTFLGQRTLERSLAELRGLEASRSPEPEPLPR